MELNTAKLVVPVLEIVPIRLADLYPEILLIRLLRYRDSVQLFQLLKNSASFLCKDRAILRASPRVVKWKA